MADGLRWLRIFSIRSGQIGMILKKTLQSILSFDTSHQVFAKLDSQTVEKQNEQLNTTAKKYSSELKFAYGRVRVRVKVTVSVRLGRPYA